MKRTTYLLVKGRAALQLLILPYLQRALAAADSDVVIYDGGSVDPEVKRLGMQLKPTAYVREDHTYPSGQPRTHAMRGQYAAMYADAQRRGLPKWVVLDDDMLPGEDAILRLHEADVTPEWPTVMPLATKQLTDYRTHDNGYLSVRSSRGLIDGAFVVLTSTPTEQVAKIDTRGIPHASRLVRPQIEIQHLGYRGGTGPWHDAERFNSPWIRHPCVDAVTGQVVRVRGFDLDLYNEAAKRGVVEALARRDRTVLLGLNAALPRLTCHASAADIAHVKNLVRACDETRYLTVVWHGLWQGNRTRARLGIPVRSRWIRLWPAGKKLPRNA